LATRAARLDEFGSHSWADAASVLSSFPPHTGGDERDERDERDEQRAREQTAPDGPAHARERFELPHVLGDGGR